MSDELTLKGLIPADLLKQEITDEEIAEVTKAGDYLPRLQVNTSNSETFKSCKVAEIGVILLIHGQQVKNLGKEVPMLAIAMRSKAMRIAETIDSYFKLGTPEFQQIMKDSNLDNSGCMFGPEFLMWVPASKTFATYFLGSTSARKEGPSVLELMKPEGSTSLQPAKVLAKVQFIKRGKFSWHNPQFAAYSPELPPPANPEKWVEKLREEVEKFKNPPESETETVQADSATGRAR